MEALCSGTLFLDIAQKARSRSLSNKRKMVSRVAVLFSPITHKHPLHFIILLGEIEMGAEAVVIICKAPIKIF